MAALHNLDDERDQMLADLDRERRDLARLTHNAARLELEGGDPDYVARVREMAATCRRWIDRITTNLEEAT